MIAEFSPPLQVIFMGTPDFAVPPLEALVASRHRVVAVYTQPPRPKGRGYEVQKSPVHLAADRHGIPVYHPQNFKGEDDREAFRRLGADVAVVAAYGLILPQAVLGAPKYGCLNIHASILPRWRGASPIQHAIWKGDAESGVTIMQMEKGLDTGPVITGATTPLGTTTTAQELHETLSKLGADIIVPVLDRLADQKHLPAVAQDDRLSTYAPMLKKEDGRIDPAVQTPVEIDRQIRALNPWPGTYLQGLKGRVKVLKAHLEEEGQKLVLELVQPDGKKPMDFKSAVNGGYL
ncbi:MAG: methionyl-tRNA formyltransferase [Rhodospirillales bacterium]|nr:methionyl-tRNA formyltransferase [Rhodospirillales bacterium]